MTLRRRVLAGLAVAVVAAVAGCLDALAPGAPARHTTVGIVPVFAGFGALDGIPSDVDSIVVTIHNPPEPDITIAQRIEPGQELIVLTVDVPLGTSTVDTVAMSLLAIRTTPAPPTVLYRADSVPLTVRVGQPTRADTVPATYVGPGQNIRSITISPRSAVLRPGDSLAFTATAIDSNGATISGMPILWSSRNTAVARVGAGGTVRGVANGSTRIVVTSGARSSVQDSADVVVATAPVAVIGFTPSSATFTAPQGGANPATQSVAVANAGAGPLDNITVSGIQYATGQSTGWLAATLGGTSAPTTLSLQATTGSLPPATYTATVRVASSLASNSPASYPVSFTVTPVPSIGLGATSVSFVDTLGTSDPAAKTVSITNAGTGTLSGLAVGAIAYGSGQPTGWATATLSGATAPATLSVTVAKGVLPLGVYTATIPVTSTVANNSPQPVTVTFDVRGLPQIALSAASLTFSDTLTTPDPAPQVVNVTNAGTGTLSGLALGTITYGSGQPTGWLTAALDSSTAPTGLTVSVAKGALTAGSYTATVPITSAVAANSPQQVSVTFTIGDLPQIGLAASSVTFLDTVTTGDPVAQTVAVTNSGTGALTGLAVGTVTYGAGQPTGWLTATLDVTTAPATLTLGAAKGALDPGVYTATVPITATLASNSPQQVTVTFDVRPLPLIGLAPSAVTIVDTITTSDPGAQTVAVTNAGTGTLTGLAVGTVTYGSGQPTGWLTATLDGTTAPATLTLQAAKGTLDVGVYTAMVPVTSAAAGNSPQQVTVTFDVRPLPLIGFSAGSVTFTDTLLTPDPAAATVAVTNVGTGTLSGLAVGTIAYGSGEPTGWLTATLDVTTAPATLTLGVAKGTLAAGTYTATVPVTSSAAGNTPQQVPVTFDVQPVPLAALKVTPGFAVLPQVGSVPLVAAGSDAGGGPAPALGLWHLSRTPAVATADSLSGLVTAVTAGTSVVVATAPTATGTTSDSTLVVVAEPGQAVALPLAGGRAFGAAKSGDTVRVLVLVDLSTVPSEKLGSYNAQLDWDPAVLQYVSATADTSMLATPTVNETGTTAGQLRFGAANADGRAGPVVRLVDIRFVATAAGSTPLTFVLTDLSGSLTFTQMLTTARVLSTSVRVQ